MPYELNRILHQPIRTRIVAMLAARGSCDYNTIKKELDLSDGHMTTHMRELLEHVYVTVEKNFVDNKPRTTYQLSPLGKQALSEYIMALKNIVLADD
jgi:DNA-binding HxlR family transcriptional regulator